MPIYGISYALPVSYSKTRLLLIRYYGSFLLQRLFSTFPSGRPGIGLLLLRAVIGLSAIAEGVLYLTSLSSPSLTLWLLGLTLILSGSALMIGFLTPLVGLFIGIHFLGIAVSWFPVPSGNLHDARLVALGLIVTTVSITLLGPGAFSLDGYLFGRREIVIPPSSGSTDL